MDKLEFKWHHYNAGVILLCAPWYLGYALSYRDMEEMMQERGLSVDHTTIYRWVQRYAPEMEKRCRPHLRPMTDSYRVDEAYIKIIGRWYCLDRAIDFTGQIIDFLLSAQRNDRTAKRFFRRMLKSAPDRSPRVINVDKTPTYPPAIEELKMEEIFSDDCRLHQCKYLNNLIEQGHRFLKRPVNPGLGCFSFGIARRMIIGHETMNIIQKRQIVGVVKGDIQGQIGFVENLFGVAA